MGLISGVFKALFPKKKRRHHFHLCGHIDDEDEWTDGSGDDWDSGDCGSDGGDGGDGGD